MTKEEFVALLADASPIGGAVDELDHLLEDAPYFHSAHQLFIKGLQMTDAKRMETQLSATALSVRDRVVLYNYLNAPVTFRHCTTTAEKPKETPAPAISVKDIPKKEQKAKPVQAVVEEAKTPEKSKEPEMAAVKAVVEEVKAPEKSKEPESAAVKAVVEEVKTPEKSKEPENTTVKTVVEEVKTPEKGKEPENTTVKAIVEEVKAPEKDKKPEIAEVKTVSEKKRDSSFDDIIEAFLKADPKISPNSETKYQVDLSESLQESKEIATETLADIYATQGYKDKAVEIYENLILKYPEKNIYFAAQIKRLKE